MRKDAEQNRQRLIEAASEIMRSEGGDVPMELIAERARLTRGTLYRNFPHRQAMYEAVLENDLRTMANHLVQDPDSDPLAFIRLMTKLMMVYDKFLISLADMADYDAGKNEARMIESVAAPLAAAQAKGLLHQGVTGGDILMACRMLASHWRLDGQPALGEAFDKRLDLIMRGLGAAAGDEQRSGAPPSRPGSSRSDTLLARSPRRRGPPDAGVPRRRTHPG